MCMQQSRLLLLVFVLATENPGSILADDFRLKLEVQDGDLWLPSSSLSVSAGARVATRCSNEGQSAQPLSWNKKDPNSGSFVLLKTGSEHEVTQVVERIQLTDSGTYSCNSSAFSTVFELYVYTLTLLQNASIPTHVEHDHIGNLRVVRRNLDQKSYAESSDTWLSCTLLTGGAHLVDLVTVHWEGGLFGLITNQTELNSLYTRVTTRNVSSEQITTRLRLTSPILDSRAYGEYRCVFGFPSSKNVFARVYLHVPPILRLVYDPPPLPPANFSNRFSCTDPPCKALTDESNISDSAVVNWTSACEVVVGYPPVLPDGLTWTWTNAHWAAYAVQRVQSVGKSAYLSELKSMAVDKNEPVSPWQILDRRRRNTQALDLYYMNSSEQPPGPVVFLCWAKNVLGESAVWWPGPIQDTGSSFWASVWWPVVGVSLELASLLVVIGLFRCCSRAGRFRSFSTARSTENTSFGLSRLFDTERPADSSYRQQEAVKRTIQLRSPGKVPYVRLSNIARPEADEHDSSVLDQHTDNGAKMHCHVNPLLADDQTEAKQATDGRDGDEYFWDSDAEPTVPVNRN